MNFSLRLITTFGILFFSFSLPGQSFTIGSFDGQNTNTTYPTSYGDNHESTRSQFLYRASELTAAGITAGNMTKLGFFVLDVTNVGVHENYTVKLMLTTVGSLTPGAWEPGSTTVYGPVDYTPVVGLNEHVFSAPFYWDGVSNLIVEVCHTADPANGMSFTENAVVQLTTSLSFFSSRTRAVNNDSDICNTDQIQEDGDNHMRPVLDLTFCYPPVNLAVTGVTSITGNLSWSPPANTSPAGYAWTFGLDGYIPGLSGIELGSGVSTLGNTSVSGLEGLTTYSFWVRSDCGDGYSTWAGPLQLITDPSCGDPFSDTGGVLDEYDINEDYVKVFCPDIPGNAINMNFTLSFPFSTSAGDTLKIYNGNNTTFPLLDALSGSYLVVPPGPYTSTTASGCLTIHFTSDEVKAPEDDGWLSFLVCEPLPADKCYEVLDLDTSNVSYNDATLSWIDMFGADTYEYELVELPGLELIHKDLAFNGFQINFDDLESGTRYRFSVRTNCTNGEHSNWVIIEFNTPVNCDGPFIQCNQNNGIIIEKPGLWDLTDCGGNTPGKERVFRFVAPNTRSYNFEITAASGGYTSYFFKAASEGCNDENWHCIDDFNVPGATTLPPIPGNTLIAGQLYYILCDPQATGLLSQTFKISECAPPLNDTPLAAIDIAVNSPCDDNIYSNIGAGLDPGEPDPDEDDSDGLTGRWLDAADETVWFKFTAPPTGTVTIFTNPKSAYIPNDDTQVALYTVGDPADYTTYQLLVSDEDNGTTYLGFNSVVSYTGLNPGTTYYIQVDGWGVNQGAFCIAVIETVEPVTQANCDADYTLTNVTGNNWFGIYATNNNLDIGPLIAAINPNDYDLGNVNCRVQTYDDIPVSANGIPYMPTYYYFTSSLAPAGEVLIRLFYTDSDFSELKTAAGAPGNGIQDLVISRYDGVIADCEQLNNSTISTLLSVNDATQMVGTFYLEFYTAVLGEFGAHFGSVPLPLELQYFSGKVLERSNRLEWLTLLEKDVLWHIVERSADGIHWTELGRQAGQANSNVPRNYTLDDLQPPGKAYYRLRSVDFDGTASVSQTILLTREADRFGIAGIFPSPTSDRLTVQFMAENEEDILIRLSDVTGRVVLEQTLSAGKGLNSETLLLGELPAGVYNITVANDYSMSEPARVVKQ